MTRTEKFRQAVSILSNNSRGEAWEVFNEMEKEINELRREVQELRANSAARPA